MTLYDKIASLKPDKGTNKQQERVYAELHYAADVSTANGGKFDKVILKAVDKVLDYVANEGAVTNKALEEAERILAPVAKTAKSYHIHCMGHAHIDMNWMWGYNETASLTVDTFRTVLDLMKEYPDFKFSQSQASVYKIIEEHAPEMLTEIAERVHEGRWELSASTWVENDKNMPSGESLSRHILYTKRYLSKLFDIDPKTIEIDFEPDTFGHNITTPEVCAQGGVKYYYHCRGREAAPCAYVWKSRAGGELLVYNEPHWYNTQVESDLMFDYPQLCKEMGSHCAAFVYGVGDHGGGPTRRDIERLIEMNSWPIMPEIIFSTYSAFFKELNKTRNALPVYVGELNYVFTGCYTSQSRIKMANRLLEDRMGDSEFLGAAAHALAGAKRRNEIMEKAWENLLFNQFHDILPGSGVTETREYAMGRFQQGMASIQVNANLSMRSLAEAIDTSKIDEDYDPDSFSEGGGVGYATGHEMGYVMPCASRGGGKKRIFHIFNTTQTDYKGVVEVTVWDWDFDPARAVFTTADGKPVASQHMKNGEWYWTHKYKVFVIEAEIPAFGYATYVLTEASIADNIHRGYPTDRNHHYNDDVLTLENNMVKAVFDHETMELLSFTDKKTGTELVKKPSAAFMFVDENTLHGGSAWVVGDRMRTTNLNRSQKVRVYDKQEGTLRQSIKYEMKFGVRSHLEVIVTLDADSRMLEYLVNVDFHEVGNEESWPQLCFEAPVGYKVNSYRYDVPYGILDREPIAHDVPANSFACALPENEKQPALMLVSDSKYGFRGWNDTLALNLVRGSTNPDPYPEYGMHRIKLGFGITETAEKNVLYDMAARFVHPVCVCSARRGEGKLTTDGKLFTTEGNVRIASVKTAEDFDGLTIRLFDPGEGADYKLTFAKAIASAAEADVNEVPGKKLNVKKNEVSGNINPYGFKTLLIKFK